MGFMNRPKPRPGPIFKQSLITTTNPVQVSKPLGFSSSTVLKNHKIKIMGLQWILLTYTVAAEAVIATLLTLPSPKQLKYLVASLISLLLQPAFFVVPFAGFQLLDLYWKYEHRLVCTAEVCTSEERDRYEKSIYKSQRNVILCACACLLYWCIYSVCNYYKQIQSLEEVEKRYKKE